ncbi:MAG TPA: TlyA family RNA methyltransferase [Aeromicrobium sp.]|nr:TlyA family RNA methyltransferase [Aeromicrobium sp.]
MTRRVRLDAELVRRKLARSREHAVTLIDDGQVSVAGQTATKPATQVQTDAAIVVQTTGERTWVSRGAYKLLGALQVFEPMGLTVAGRSCLDAGASTGGFTEVLLDRGAEIVHAVDVGYGQLAWSLQSDSRVHILDRTNIRDLQPTDLDGDVDLIVSDLSFISLTVVLPALARLASPRAKSGEPSGDPGGDPGGDMVLMIKPQFEVGRGNLGKNGVVRDATLHSDAVQRVCESAYGLGWGTRALAPSPLPGPAGNVEYFCWLRTDADAPAPAAAERVVATGPLGAMS